MKNIERAQLKFGDPRSIQIVRAARNRAERAEALEYAMEYTLKVEFAIDISGQEEFSCIALDEADAVRQAEDYLVDQYGLDTFYHDLDIIGYEVKSVRPKPQNISVENLSLFAKS